MAHSNIVDQDGNIQSIDQCLQFGIILVIVGAKIHGKRLRLSIIFRLDLSSQGIKFGRSAGDEESGKAGTRELKGIFFPNAIGGSGHEGPGLGGLTERTKLRCVLAIDVATKYRDLAYGFSGQNEQTQHEPHELNSIQGYGEEAGHSAGDQ